VTDGSQVDHIRVGLVRGLALSGQLATAQQSAREEIIVESAATPEFAPKPGAAAQEDAQRGEFRTLDADVQDLKKQVLDLNRDLFLLEEELLFRRTRKWRCSCRWTSASSSRWTP
jgi:hypothetical protein